MTRDELDAAISSVQRIAMKIEELPVPSRDAALKIAEQAFTEATTKFGIDPERGRQFVDLQMGALRALVREIELAGGAAGGNARH
jgi:hypothetical protein